VLGALALDFVFDQGPHFTTYTDVLRWAICQSQSGKRPDEGLASYEKFNSIQNSTNMKDLNVSVP